MKGKKYTAVLVLIGASIIFTAAAKADPVQYEFNGILGGELFTSPTLPESQYPVPVGTTFNGAFTYDSSLPISYTTNDAYGAFSNLVGSIGNNYFSSTSGNAAFSSGSLFGGIFGDSQADNFQGFNVNGFTLTGVLIVYSNPSTNNVLPASLPQNPFVVAFNFSDGSNLYQFYSASATVNPVPIPSAIWFFTSSLLSLVGASRRKFK